MGYYYNYPSKAHQEWEWEKITLRKARTRYLYSCYECGEDIKNGEEYISDTFKYDEIFRTNKICLNCWKGRIP